MAITRRQIDDPTDLTGVPDGQSQVALTDPSVSNGDQSTQPSTATTANVAPATTDNGGGYVPPNPPPSLPPPIPPATTSPVVQPTKATGAIVPRSVSIPTSTTLGLGEGDGSGGSGGGDGSSGGPTGGGGLPAWQDPNDPIVKAYLELLGRMPESEAAWASHEGDPNFWLNIYNSPEAVAHRANQSQPSAPPSGPPTAHTPGNQHAQTYATPYDAFTALLGNGGDPQSIVDEVNAMFGLGSGNSAEYYAPGTHDSSGLAYIGLPNGYFANDQANGGWSWHVRGPETGGGGGGSGGGGSSSTIDPSLLAKLFSAGSGGVFGNNNLQQVGTDPFSQLIEGGLAALIASGGKGIGGNTPQEEAAAMEAARAPYEAARKVQLTNAQAALADRGLLSETSPGTGLESDAVGRIETNLAPSYTAAIDQNLLELRNQSNQEAQTLLNTLTASTNRQSALSQIALQELAQNQSFQEFLATFGLQKDQVLYQLANGQSSQLISLIEAFLQATGTAGGGFI